MSSSQELANEFTSARIGAYLFTVVPMDGHSEDMLADSYARGRQAIEDLAASAIEDGEPTKRLTPGECADIVYFVNHAEPRDPAAFYRDRPRGRPSPRCGMLIVLNAVEDTMRRLSRTRRAA